LDNLEELIRTNNPDAQRTQGMQQGIDRPSPLTALKNLGSPALERTEAAVRYYINIETVLSWHVFHDQNLDQRLDLKYLLQSENSHPEPAPLSIPPDFETNGAGQLLENFFENVHIYNPVLEVAKVKQYLRDSQFNGLGLNAQSCLLVSKDALPPDLVEVAHITSFLCMHLDLSPLVMKMFYQNLLRLSVCKLLKGLYLKCKFHEFPTSDDS
jgi:hypothetical protein